MLKTMINEVKDYRNGDIIEYDSVTQLPASIEFIDRKPAHIILSSGGPFANVTSGSVKKSSTATTVVEMESATDLEVTSEYEK